jgi:hypothetical protein
MKVFRHVTLNLMLGECRFAILNPCEIDSRSRSGENHEVSAKQETDRRGGNADRYGDPSAANS